MVNFLNYLIYKEKIFSNCEKKNPMKDLQSYTYPETYKYLKMHFEVRSFNEKNNAWARSLVRQSDGLLIHRPGVQIPSSPLIFLPNFFLKASFGVSKVIDKFQQKCNNPAFEEKQRNSCAHCFQQLADTINLLVFLGMVLY